jgi:hypothetical protein
MNALREIENLTEVITNRNEEVKSLTKAKVEIAAE